MKKLQQMLSRARLPSSGAIYQGQKTGVYGDRTVQAVMLLQLCNGLHADGFYSPEIREALAARQPNRRS